MDRLMLKILFVFCVLVIKANSIIASDSESVTFAPYEELTTKSTTTTLLEDKQDFDDNDDEKEKFEQRSINSKDLPLNNPERHEAFRKRAKPLKRIFMGIYKNYKSTYLGNKTFAEYKRTLRTHAPNDSNAPFAETADMEEEADVKSADNAETSDPIEFHAISTEANDVDNEAYSIQDQNETELKSILKEAKSQRIRKKKKKQRSRKRNLRRKKHGTKYVDGENKIFKKEYPIYSYDFGPAVNMSLDMNNEIVKLHLDSENLYDIMQGRWLKDKSEGRGRKYAMITRVLPLFIIPFLIQSAVVPFLVTKLKLLLMKSILVGKLAIFLLVLSAIKNSNKMMQTYEVAPSYWAGEPSRRSELAAAASTASAASAAAYNGYRVEGKPTAWIN